MNEFSLKKSLHVPKTKQPVQHCFRINNLYENFQQLFSQATRPYPLSFSILDHEWNFEPLSRHRNPQVVPVDCWRYQHTVAAGSRYNLRYIIPELRAPPLRRWKRFVPVSRGKSFVSQTSRSPYLIVSCAKETAKMRPGCDTIASICRWNNFKLL